MNVLSHPTSSLTTGITGLFVALSPTVSADAPLFKEAHNLPYLVTINGRDFTGLTDGILAPGQIRPIV